MIIIRIKTWGTKPSMRLQSLVERSVKTVETVTWWETWIVQWFPFEGKRYVFLSLLIRSGMSYVLFLTNVFLDLPDSRLQSMRPFQPFVCLGIQPGWFPSHQALPSPGGTIRWHHRQRPNGAQRLQRDVFQRRSGSCGPSFYFGVSIFGIMSTLDNKPLGSFIGGAI